MILNYLKAAWRNLKKNKFLSFLNIVGLAIGMAVFLLIAQYVHFEYSYENFIPGRENIYRVSLSTYRSNQLTMATAQTYPAIGPAMKSEIPGVAGYARLFNIGYRNFVVISNENAKPQPVAIKQRNCFLADSSFLPMMGYKMIKGNAHTALVEPNTAVLSEKYARLYFGNDNPIGKHLRMRDDDLNDDLVTVTGIVKDPPLNTHLKFDILVSNRSQSGIRYDQKWNRANMYTFVELTPGTDFKNVELKLAALISEHKPGVSEGGEKQMLSLMPVKDIHLSSTLSEEPDVTGDSKIVFFISLIGVLVIIIAWINYVNMYTAKSITRAKEVGVRKVMGVTRRQLIVQFLAESFVINLLAILIACNIVVISLPYFNAISGLQLDTSYLLQPWFLGVLFILWMAGSFFSGFYPALVISSFNPIGALKGKLKNSLSGVMLRKGLVITQFVASVVLIAGTLVVYLQLQYMMNRNIGMNIDQVMILERPAFIPGKNDEAGFEAAINFFRNDLSKNPAIESTTSPMTIPGKQREYKDVIASVGSMDSISVRVNTVDHDFTKVFEMKFIAGNNFRDIPGGRDTSVIITETAAHLLGYRDAKDAVGKQLAIQGYRRYRMIVGVVNDYHQLSLKNSLEPGIFYYSAGGGGYFALRVHTNQLKDAIQHAQQSWVKAFAGNPFEYFFLDDYFNKQYMNEQKFEKLFTTFSILAIIISCLGLFGLSSYMATQRTKEIGIRKVLGASVMNITSTLSKEFLKLVIIAVLIASPVAYIVMTKWLQGFAYRIEVSWWVLAVAGLAAVVIACITISFQTIKAAIANPVKSLRME